MTSKSILAEEIQALQSSASAICHACALRLTPKCWGPACADIIRIVNQIDPKVSEYFRLELAEKQQQRRKATGNPIWQRHLPLTLPEEALNGAAECAVAVEEALISKAPGKENVKEVDATMPPEGWGYSLLQFVLGWETPSNALPTGTVAASIIPPVEYDEISRSQSSPPLQATRKPVGKHSRTQEPFRVVSTKSIS